MKCVPRQVLDDEVEQDVTQRDQFNSDDFVIAETLIRESHQNSLDGRSPKQDGPVRTRVVILEARPEDADLWRSLLLPLVPHLKASTVDFEVLDLSKPRLLVIEDFGTTGLLGDWDKKDERNFSDFWRRFGVSHKGGTAAGRWGLGKLVFSSASLIGTFFGLTIRDDDPNKKRLLMGQAVLNRHSINGVNYAPHIFLSEVSSSNLQIPVFDKDLVDRFVAASGISRKKEPGLSIVVACVNPSLDLEKLLPYVLSNYFFPILTERLVVEIGGKTVSEATFDSLAGSYGRELADRKIASFIRELQAARANAPHYSLSSEWEKAKAGEAVTSGLKEDELANARSTYEAGGMVAVRAPLKLQRKGGMAVDTYIDAYLRKAPDVTLSVALYVRGSITIPGEAKGFRGRGVFGALLASEQQAVEFLGDAENPAHTRWIATSDKLNKRWSAAPSKVAAVRRLLNDFYEAITDAHSKIDENLLVQIFSVPKPNPSPTPKPPRPGPPPTPPLPPKPQAFRVVHTKGGFAVRGNVAAERELPYNLTVQVAYDVRRGNSFGKYSPLDFDITKPAPIRMTSTHVNATAMGPNKWVLQINSHGFEFKATGFDPERDLEVKVS